MPTAGSHTIQPRQGATMSRWKVAATAETMCRHVLLPESLCYGELSLPQPQSTGCTISLQGTVSSALCDLTGVLRPLPTALSFQYTQL